MSLGKYNNLLKNANNYKCIYFNKRDKWQRKADATIQEFVKIHIPSMVNDSCYILNITNPKMSLGLSCGNIENIDISCLLNKHTNQTYDIIICDRNVISNVDPMIVFEKFQKILRPLGLLVFTFENSNALKFLFKKDFNRMVVFANNVYSKQKEWHYSDNWINELLGLNKFGIIKTYKFHYFFSFSKINQKNESKSRTYLELDTVFRNIPFVRSLASNTIVFCQKKD